MPLAFVRRGCQTPARRMRMPNFFSAFTSEVFRPLVTLLIPGAIGISPWFIGLLWHFAKLRRLVDDNHTETAFVVLMGMTFAGVVFEDFGARSENWLDGRADQRTQKAHSAQWYGYLRSAFRADPIGRRYMRALVLRLKFELGVAFAMAIASLGVLWLAYLGLSWLTVLIVEGICVLFISWGLWEACETHSVLAKTRAALLEDIRIVG
jgi:hypothetical protein